MRRRRRVALRIASVLAGTAIGAALLAIGLRIADVGPLGDDLDSLRASETAWHDPNTRFDPDLGWAPIASRRVALDWGTIETDEHGFRSPPLRPGSERIAVLGDSVAWGYGVDGDATFAAHMARALAARDIQVANLSVSGFGIDQTWLWFATTREALPRLRHAVLALCAANDVKDTQSNTRYGRRKPLFRATGGSGSGEIELEAGTIRRHSLRHWLTDSRLLQGALARFPAQGEWIRARLGDTLLDRAETDLVIGALLARIARETRDRGGELHVLLLPSRDDLVREGDDYALLRSRARSAGLPLIEVTAQLRAATLGGAQPERAYFDAMHLRPNAHALVARAVLDALASSDSSIAEALRTRSRSQTDSAALRRSGGP